VADPARLTCARDRYPRREVGVEREKAAQRKLDELRRQANDAQKGQ